MLSLPSRKMRLPLKRKKAEAFHKCGYLGHVQEKSEYSPCYVAAVAEARLVRLPATRREKSR